MKTRLACILCALPAVAMVQFADAQATQVATSIEVSQKDAQANRQVSLDLETLQRAAVAHDARNAQRQTLLRSADLQINRLRMNNRPQLSIAASNSHASDVTHLDLVLPGGTASIPPRDSWNIAASISQLLYDGGALSSRSAVERARLTEKEASLDAALEPLREEVARYFFSAILLGATRDELSVAAQRLEQILADTRLRVREGAALGRDSAAVRAEWLMIRFRIDEVETQQRAAFASLSLLTGEPIDIHSRVMLPDWSARLDSLSDIASLRVHPEFRRFASARERIKAEEMGVNQDGRPKAVAFATTGIGRPGLNLFNHDQAAYWQFGVRLEWTPFTWGNKSRSLELLALQSQAVLAEEEAFADRLARSVQADMAERDRLKRQVISDEELIALRELAVEQGEAQRREGVITGAEAISLLSDLTEARLTRERHRIQLAQAEVRVATTLGLSAH